MPARYIDSARTEAIRRLLVIVLCLFAFGMSGIISRTVFERLPHLEDEMAYLFQARTLAGGNLVIDTPSPALAFWQPFVVDRDGTRFGKYTIGFPLQLAVGTRFGQEWVINAFFAALTAALVYRLGRAVFNPDVGMIAAGLVAFSPAALLLNGTLMGHSAALFATVAFIYSYWRMERASKPSPPAPQGEGREEEPLAFSPSATQRRRRRGGSMRFGIAAGIALGILIASRPLTAIGIAAPFVAWSGIGLLRALLTDRARFFPLLRPLVPLVVIALAFALLVPLYNYAATGNPSQNLYTLVWEYDRVGFGEGYGRHGHTIEKGVRHTRFDLSLTAADLFGWQIESVYQAPEAVRPDLVDHWVNQADYYPATGISWILLPLGFIVAFRWKSPLIFGWFALGAAWLALPFVIGTGDLSRDPRFSWLTIIGLMGWLCAPLLVLRKRVNVWTWLIAAAALGLIIIQLGYWIGSQRYSTRYYYEGLASAALLTALPLAWLARRWGGRLRPFVYIGVAVTLIMSLFLYSLPRIGALYGFNLIDRTLLDGVNARREGQPALVIITGTDIRWRAYGELMAQTSPYRDSPIVAARVASRAERDRLVAQFPDRLVIDLNGQENSAWFADEPPPE